MAGAGVDHVKEIPPPPTVVKDFLYQWRTWLFSLFAGTVHKNTTGNLTVGHTTDVHAVGNITSNHAPDLTLEHLKTATVTGNIIIDEPSDTGHCEYYLTIDTGGPFTVSAGTGVKYVGTLPSLTTGTNYVLNVRRYGSLQTVIQVVALT